MRKGYKSSPEATFGPAFFPKVTMAFSISFPHRDSPELINQEAECADVTFCSSANQREHTERIFFHDYPKIFAHPGLYE